MNPNPINEKRERKPTRMFKSSGIDVCFDDSVIKKNLSEHEEDTYNFNITFRDEWGGVHYRIDK